MQTDADCRRDSAIDHINSAIYDLGKIVVEQCYGCDEYNTDYQECLLHSLNSLIKIRQALS